MTALPIEPLTLQTAARNQMLEITADVQQAVDKRRVRSGLAVLHVAHTTAGLTINENADATVKADMLKKLDALVPQIEPFYRHDEGNSDAHLKASLMGSSVTVLIENGRLQLGRWQGIYLCEFDGPRERRVLVKLVSFEEGK